MRAARRAVEAAVGATANVSGVVAAPGGPLFVVTPDHEAAATLSTDQLVGLATEPLQQAAGPGCHVAVMASGGTLDELDDVPDAAVLRLFGPPAGADGEIDAAWVEAAAEWVLGDLHALDTVRVRILGVEFRVTAPDAVHVLHDCLEAQAWCDLVQGDLDDRLRTVGLTFGPLPHLAMGVGGPGAGAEGLLEHFGMLRDLARELAGTVTWACITFDHDFGRLATGLSGAGPDDRWADREGAPANAVAAWLVDSHVPAVFTYQVLSPSHHVRLESLPAGAVPLRDGRVELSVGDPADWLGGEVPGHAYGAALRALGPLLVTDAEFDELISERVDPDEPDAPALESVVLEAAPHRRRSNRVTLLELVAWLAGQPHSDDPEGVSAPLGTFGRWLAAGLDAVPRQALRTTASGLVGSAASPEVERQRAWALTRWLVQVHATAWLRRAGMSDVANQLSTLALADPPDLATAARALSTAAVTAHRRLLLTPAFEDPAWQVWEAISEPSGWVAAGEGATAGTPGEVATAAEQRVIDVVRRRGDPEVDPAALANEVWSVAIGALADHLWTEGWHAADAVTTVQANTDLAGPALGATEEIWDALDGRDRAGAATVAHDAARGPLARVGLALGAGGSGPPWDLALDAAAQAPGAASWWTGIRQARTQVGREVWATAMESARARVAAIGEDAPDLVSRVRLVALAREAAGAAARLVAAEAVTDAMMATPASTDAAKWVDAAIGALQPAVDELGRSAIALLDELLAAAPS